VNLLLFLLGFIVQADFTVIHKFKCRHIRMEDFCVGVFSGNIFSSMLIFFSGALILLCLVRDPHSFSFRHTYSKLS
jgi:hypothetical protein